LTEPKPSKSAAKRKAQEIKALGEQLLSLGEQEVAGLELDERLVDALELARRMKSREALRRHKQYIAKLLMNTDTEPLRALIDQREATERRQKQHFRNAERWRDRLVRERHAALDAFESTLGRSQPELSRLLHALERTHSDREEKAISKSIFRAVFEALR
jgi:ribosome-associated protein